MRMIVFATIIIIVFSLAGYYVYSRLSQTFPHSFITSKTALALFIFLLSSFFIGKIFENISINIFSESLIRIGSVAAGFFIYGLLTIVFFDILRGINAIIPFFPSIINNNYEKTKFIIGVASFAIIGIVLLTGFINTLNPKIKKLELTINKPKSTLKELNIVAVSDIHLGTMVNHSKAKRLVEIIKELNPDLVLIGGDIIDDNVQVVMKNDILKHFKDLKPKYGVYSCLGNHEYISKAYKELDYFEENGMKMLRDTSVNIENLFYIIGRDDKEARNFGGSQRLELNELIQNIDFELPVFLLDHQPFKLDETAEFPIDFQFSGHTHRGQFWPFNYITALVFEKDWGYLKKKNTHFYISSGYGTSVIPIRVGNDSEIVQIKIQNKA